MTKLELLEKLKPYHDSIEIQAVACAGHHCDGRTDEPVIEERKDKSGVTWLVIRA